MQQRPTAAELLATIAEVLERDVVPALGGPAQHHARVAASLAGIVERELRLGPDAAAREHAALASLIPDAPSDLVALRQVAADRLRAGFADDEPTYSAAWNVLMAIVKDDLAIAKPGHDSWEGA